MRMCYGTDPRSAASAQPVLVTSEEQIVNSECFSVVPCHWFLEVFAMVGGSSRRGGRLATVLSPPSFRLSPEPIYGLIVFRFQSGTAQLSARHLRL